MIAALCLALAAVTGAAVAAKPHGGKGAKPRPKAGQLDPSFGQGGTFTVATPPIVSEDGQVVILPTHLAVAPSNKSYAQQGQLVVGFGADGKPDPRFGNHGRVWVQPGPGRVVEVSGVAVDSQGRILVAGTYEPFPGFKNPIAKGKAEALLFGDEPATEAFVVRYLPSGQPDPTFGGGGVVITSLNVPRPTNEPYGEKAPTAEYERPVVTISGIQVDADDRPVLAGQYVYGQRTCFFKQQYKHAIVARLTASGSVDTSFGSDGFTAISGERTLAFAGGPGGEWVALGEQESACYRDLPPHRSTTAVLSEAGAPSTALDPARPTLDTGGALAVDQQGRILVAEEEGEGGFGSGQPKIVRLLPDGDIDTSFGHEGGIALSRFDPAWPEAIAVDPEERIVVALGSTSHLELTRLTSAGKLDGRFGDHALASGLKEMTGQINVAIDSKGRVLTAGPSEAQSLKTGQGIGIARFLPGD